jgi:toxin ParE1/3/4
MKVRIARDAKADLNEIWFYIAGRQSVEAAQRVVDRLTDKFYLLAKFPEIGRLRPDLHPALRSFPVGEYRIYYAGTAKVCFESCTFGTGRGMRVRFSSSSAGSPRSPAATTPYVPCYSKDSARLLVQPY